MTTDSGCRCGRKGCDCARWERIFKERFEDPDYYNREPGVGLSAQSTLRSVEQIAPDLADLADLRTRPEPQYHWRRQFSTASK